MPTIQEVRAAAAQHEGQAIFLSSQSLPPLRTMLHEVGSGAGICDMLVAKWMVDRAAGRDFWGWLYEGPDRPSSAAVGNVVTNTRSLGQVNVHRDRGRMRNRPSGTPAEISDYLRLYGLVETRHALELGNNGRVDVAHAGGVADFIAALLIQPLPTPIFLRLCLLRKKEEADNVAIGHAIGIHFDFFHNVYDPNLGEFEFTLKTDLIEWLTEQVCPYYEVMRYHLVFWSWFDRA